MMSMNKQFNWHALLKQEVIQSKVLTETMDSRNQAPASVLIRMQSWSVLQNEHFLRMKESVDCSPKIFVDTNGVLGKCSVILVRMFMTSKSSLFSVRFL
jgi:hypothetical protein